MLSSLSTYHLGPGVLSAPSCLDDLRPETYTLGMLLAAFGDGCPVANCIQNASSFSGNFEKA